MSRKIITGELDIYEGTGTEEAYWVSYEEGLTGYNALNVTGHGDHLTIFDLNDKVVFVGEVEFEREPIFTKSIGGFWVHYSPLNCDENDWFKYFWNGYKAVLIRSEVNAQNI